MKSFIRKDAKLVFNSNPKLAVELIAQSLERIGTERAAIRKKVMNALHLSKEQADSYTTETLYGLYQNAETAERKLAKANRRFLAANARGKNKKAMNNADELWDELMALADSESATADAAQALIDDYGMGDWEDDEEMQDFVDDYHEFMRVNHKALKNEKKQMQDEEEMMNRKAKNRKARNSKGNFAGKGAIVENAAGEDDVLRPMSTCPPLEKK